MRAWQAAKTERLRHLAGAVGVLDLDVVKKRARDVAGDAWRDTIDADIGPLGKRRFLGNLERVLDGTALPPEIDDCSKEEAAALNRLHIAQRRGRVDLERRHAVWAKPVARGRWISSTSPSASYWGRSSVRSLLIYGRHDKNGTPENAHDLQRRLGAELVMFEDAGHFVVREKEDRVAELILAFAFRRRSFNTGSFRAVSVPRCFSRDLKSGSSVSAVVQTCRAPIGSERIFSATVSTSN